MTFDKQQLLSLAAVCAAALNYRALGFDAEFGPGGKVTKIQSAGPQRKFAALLVCESFGRGQEWGQLDAKEFHKILANGDRASIWRIPFIHELMVDFRRNAWMTTNNIGQYRLLVDRWPNWAEVKQLMRERDHARLHFAPDDELNEMLAKISNLAVLPDDKQLGLLVGETFAVANSTTPGRGETFATIPSEPPKPVETPSFSRSHGPVNPPAKSSPSPVHVTCNNNSLKQLHVHEGMAKPAKVSPETKQQSSNHEVGELNKRTTDQILSDIRKLAPDISAENLKHWSHRIEIEDAELVNAVIRQAQLQKRSIRNMPAWMNSCYLTAIRARKQAPDEIAKMKEACK